jgi:homoserine O-acetyltransferase
MSSARPDRPSLKGWWDGLVGPGAAIDTDRYHVVCPNVLGGCQGTTGPSSLDSDGRPFGSRFPVVTIRDQVAVEIALADQLGIEQWACVLGGSMGGMRVLEWCIEVPDRVARAMVLSVGAAASADQIALSSLQIRAIRSDPAFHGGDYYETSRRPVDGLSIARGIGHYSYRTGNEFEKRFGHEAQGEEEPLKGGRYAIESYLQYQGEKLAKRFDPNSYITLSEAMNHHDVGRGRGGIGDALRRVQAGRDSWPASSRIGSTRSHSKRSWFGIFPVTAAGLGRRIRVRARRLPVGDRTGGSHRAVRPGRRDLSPEPAQPAQPAPPAPLPWRDGMAKRGRTG